jgi:hypothetical protein
MKVRAKVLGFAKSRRIRPGEEFEIPDSQEPGDWMEIVEGPKAPQAWQKAGSKRRRGTTLDILREKVDALSLRVTQLEAAAQRSLLGTAVLEDPAPDKEKEPETISEDPPEDKGPETPAPPRRGPGKRKAK